MRTCRNCGYEWRYARPLGQQCPKCGLPGPHGNTSRSIPAMEIDVTTPFGHADVDERDLSSFDDRGADRLFVVAYDGSPLSRTALERADELADGNYDVVVLTAVPFGNTPYARAKGWLDGEEAFVVDAVVDRLSRDLRRAAVDVNVDFLLVPLDRWAPTGVIAHALRKAIDEIGPEVVFVGSRNAGRKTTSLDSVAGGLVAGQYDVYIARG
ncbi:MAG: universal stress protein [Haloarculaceae archaeon]